MASEEPEAAVVLSSDAHDHGRRIGCRGSDVVLDSAEQSVGEPASVGVNRALVGIVECDEPQIACLKPQPCPGVGYGFVVSAAEENPAIVPARLTRG